MMEFGDQDLRIVLNRAFRNVLIGIAVGIPVIWIAWGWRSMLLFVLGGAIAATGVVEWRQLMGAALQRLDATDSGKGTGRKPLGPILFWFVVRLLVAGALLYVSLRSLGGNVAALIIGIVLGLIALTVEALRMLRGFTT